MLLNQKIKKTSGFTLIELLVVIVIIGALAAIVLASLGSARSKGGDAAVKSNLSNVRGQAALYYDTNNSSFGSSVSCNITASGTIDPGCTGVFGSTGIQAGLKAAASAAGSTAYGYTNAAGSAWAAGVTLSATNVYSASSGTDYFCVDSVGASAIKDTMTLTSSFTVCP